MVNDIVYNEVILDYTGLPTPVLTGYTLDGWAYDEAGTEPVGATDTITASDTIYAIFTEDI